MKIKEFLHCNDQSPRHDDRPHVDLVRFGDNDTDSNYLRLIEHTDGRIDLVDCNCGDTGTDCGDSDLVWLQGEVENWLACIDATPEDVEDAQLFQIS